MRNTLHRRACSDGVSSDEEHFEVRGTCAGRTAPRVRPTWIDGRAKALPGLAACALVSIPSANRALRAASIPRSLRSRVPPSSVAGSARGRGHRRAVVRRDAPHAAPLLRPTPPRGFARPDALAAGRSRGSAWVARGGPTVRWVAPSSGASCDGGRGNARAKRAGDGGRAERSIRRGNGDQSTRLAAWDRPVGTGLRNGRRPTSLTAHAPLNPPPGG